jgi:hypothetical protein
MSYPFPINVNIPNAPNNPADDQPQMKLNFQNIAGFLAVDHVAAGAVNAGYHDVIHMVIDPGDVNPTPIASIGQLYVKQITSAGNPDEALFYESGGGRVTQLTTNLGSGGNTYLAATNGYTTLPGGLIFQWGYQASSGGVVNVTLPIVFPNNVFNIQATMNRNSSNVDVIYAITPPTMAAFSVIQFRDTSSGNPFYWTAIGN